MKNNRIKHIEQQITANELTGLSSITVQRLNHLSRGREIWCIGCGKRLNELLDLYKREVFIRQITKLMDNNKRLWGIQKPVGNRILLISGTEKIKKVNSTKPIIVITSDHAQEIYESIKPEITRKKWDCFVYPKYYYTLTPIILSCVKKLPLKRQLLFYAGNEPHENADEIVKYLRNDYPGKKYEIYYFDNGRGTGIQGIHYINKGSVRMKASIADIVKYLLIYGRSSCLFYENEPLEKIRADQKLFFLNHGTIPLKNVSDVLQQPQEVDFALCPGESCSELYENQYGIVREKLLYIMPPRVYGMLKCKSMKDRLVTTKKNMQLILWLPTFRQLVGCDRTDSEITDPFMIINSSWEELNGYLYRNQQLLLIKEHPREKKARKISNKYSNIKVVHDSDLQREGISMPELLKTADALLTDYSGIAFEYMLLDRPIGYVVFDIEKYFRGFSVENPFELMPGPKLKSYSDLEQFLMNVKFGHDDFKVERKKLVQYLFNNKAYENGAKELIHFIDTKL